MSVDRGEPDARAFLTAAVRRGTPLHTTEPVVAQVWRHGSRQARLARFLTSVSVHPLDDGREVGVILARSGTADAIDAHLVSVVIRLAEPILTGDGHDFDALVASLPDRRPPILPWN